MKKIEKNLVSFSYLIQLTTGARVKDQAAINLAAFSCWANEAFS